MKRQRFQEATFYSYTLSMFHPQIQIGNFSNECTDLKPLWIWQYCALPAEKREDRLYLEIGNAENACGHWGIGELLKDLGAGHTVKSTFLVCAKCWHHILPLCIFICKSFESCNHLLTFKTLPPVHWNSREEVAFLKTMYLESLYFILLANVSILGLTSDLWCICVCCLPGLLCLFLLSFVCRSAERKKINLSLQGNNLL